MFTPLRKAIPFIPNGFSAAFLAVIPKIPPMEAGSTGVTAINRIVQAICEHIIAGGALAGRNKGVCIDESTESGVVVTGLEIVEGGLLGNSIATAPKSAPHPPPAEVSPRRGYCYESVGYVLSAKTFSADTTYFYFLISLSPIKYSKSSSVPFVRRDF